MVDFSKIWPFHSTAPTRQPRVYSRMTNSTGSARLDSLEKALADEAAGKRSPMQWKLFWLIDGFACGRTGIRPLFTGDEAAAAARAWDDWKIDAAERLNPRDFQRVLVASLVMDGEIFIWQDAGTFTPLPSPYEIHYDEGNLPVSYEWPRGVLPGDRAELPADAVIHLYIHTRPGQKRGDNLFVPVADIANRRLSYIRSAIRQAEMLARHLFALKSDSTTEWETPETAKSDADAAEPDVEKIDFSSTDNVIWQIGPNDEVQPLPTTGQSFPPAELDKLIWTTLAMPHGISPMQMAGDFSATNYSSARFADLTDRTVYARYQDLILRAMQIVYPVWDDLPQYAGSFSEWHVPAFPVTDPQRYAQQAVALVTAGLKSPQAVMRDLDLDPDQMFAEMRRAAEEQEERNRILNPPTEE